MAVFAFAPRENALSPYFLETTFLVFFTATVMLCAACFLMVEGSVGQPSQSQRNLHLHLSSLSVWNNPGADKRSVFRNQE